MDIIHCLIKSLTAYIVPQLVFSSIVAVMRFTFIVAVCFTLNYTIGSGFLTLPWAFLRSRPNIGTMYLNFVWGTGHGIRLVRAGGHGAC